MSPLTTFPVTSHQIIRRTFEAAKHPKGSAERSALNCDAATSEYLPSYRYILRKPALMSDGTQNPSQRFHDLTFRTKADAVAYAATV